jgi:hypothetical protein
VGIEIVVVHIMTLCVLVNGWQVSERHAAFIFVGAVSQAEKVAGYENRPLKKKKGERTRAVNDE